MNLLDDLVRICASHILTGSDAAVVREPYAPFLPDADGSWNRVLVLGEAQNLSTTYDSYVRRLRETDAEKRIRRLYWEPELHVRPWDEGTLKLAMSAAFDSRPERFAVSNAVLWSTVQASSRNQTPPETLRAKSAEVWKEMLPLLEPTHVVTTGTVARQLIAGLKVNLAAGWTHIPLCSASNQYLAGRAARVTESQLLARFPRLSAELRAHPEYVTKYRRNRIYFAAEAVAAVQLSGRVDR